MIKPAWQCAAGHCPTKHKLPKDLRRVYRCGGCKKLYHSGCSGGHPYDKCDECWAKEKT